MAAYEVTRTYEDEQTGATVVEGRVTRADRPDYAIMSAITAHFDELPDHVNEVTLSATPARA